MKDIKVGLGVCFLNAEKEIPRLLDPIYKHVDKIYGIHGRFINYEAKEDFSTDNSEEVFKKYPNAIVERYKPAFQTDMRQHYLDLAGEDKMDYLIVMDTDDIIYPTPECQRWDYFYKSIQRYSKRYPEYRIFKMKAWIPGDKVWRKAYNANASNSWVPYIRIHKDPGTMRYCLFCHYWFAPKDASDEDLILQKRGMFISDHTIDGVRFTTNSFLRGAQQLDIRDNWAWNNIQEEQRRLYIFQNRINYNAPKTPDWIKTEFDGYWRYDKQGKPISKICEEDGTLVK